MKTQAYLKLAALSAAFFTTTAIAVPFTVTSTLLGDPRAGHPDNLIVNATITGDTTSNTANWLFDINSPFHPSIKLHEFYFNLTGSASDYSFTGFNPTGWSLATPATNAAGSGGADFMFKALDPAGPPNAANVTNSQSLSFSMTYGLGNLSINNFLLAATSVSNDSALGSGQLGAHLQSLSTAGCTDCSNSGFALGNYTTGSDIPPNPVPESDILSLLAAGLIGFGAKAKRRRTA